MKTFALLLMALSLVGVGCAAKSPVTPATGAQDLRRAGEARAVAAQTMLDGLEQRYRANEPLTPDFLDQLVVWSRRAMEAKIDTAATRADRIAAAKTHLARSRELLSVIMRREEPPRRIIDAQGYHVADAEYRLAQIMAEDKPS